MCAYGVIRAYLAFLSYRNAAYKFEPTDDKQTDRDRILGGGRQGDDL